MLYNTPLLPSDLLKENYDPNNYKISIVPDADTKIEMASDYGLTYDEISKSFEVIPVNKKPIILKITL